MKSIILKIGLLLLMICCSLLVELTFEGNRFTKDNALIATSIAIVVFAVVSMIKQPQPQKKLD